MSAVAGMCWGCAGDIRCSGDGFRDPDGIEGPAEKVAGLGLLPVDTVLAPTKRVRSIAGTHVAGGARFAGYEIHAGITTVDPATVPMLRFADGSMDGAVAGDGRIAGCYVHGLFDAATARAHWLATIGAVSDGLDRRETIDAALDGIATVLAATLDIDRLLAIAQEGV